MNKYQNLLCLVDLSDENRVIVERAAELARHYGASLTLLHVVEPLPSYAANNIVLPDDIAIEEQLTLSAKEALSKLTSEMGLDKATTLVEVGPTKNTILEITKDRKIDLIVIGRHGRHGIARLLGSTATSVVHHAPCDVLTVHVGE